MTRRLKAILLRIDRLLLPDDDEVGRLPYAWLIYLGFLFFPLTLGEVEPGFWWATLISMALFIPLYFWSFRLTGWKLLCGVVPMVGLCAVVTPFNPSAFTYAIYAAAYSPGYGSPRAGLISVVGVVAAVLVVFWVHSLPLPFFLMGLLIPLMVGVSNIYFNELNRKNAEIKLSQQEVRRLAGKAERERIARDLHDLLGHTLSVMVRKTELARRLVSTDPERAGTEMAEVESVGRQALSQVREAVSGWRAPELAAELAATRLTLESADISAQIDEPPEIPGHAGRVLAMVLREAVTNIIRHSGAEHGRVEFEQEQAGWTMRVCDDGRGCTPEEGNGIQGMRERLADIGGRLELNSDPGCTLVAWVPDECEEQAA
ncbi:sensor histidine kinase [Wenzhouxiangella sp. AB-CW3]|uniref:sensor histidine kinase n=1 Tax=Wenzhouxiangella sp. AB-CW3 TaxID=2771012 RepID=UPI00168AE778|nr:sensor histidine kinase [Wenzhouxiangella sp. AB-CW3]QOC23228.1 sensor histidine kinase [Wenzhouxiangella sp. AB-CW3]